MQQNLHNILNIFFNLYLSVLIVNMNSMIDFVSSYHLFMNNDEQEKKEKSEQIELQEKNEINLYSKEQPKYKKKPLHKIFNLENQKLKKNKK
jgi:hypothetical protein